MLAFFIFCFYLHINVGKIIYTWACTRTKVLVKHLEKPMPKFGEKFMITIGTGMAYSRKIHVLFSQICVKFSHVSLTLTAFFFYFIVGKYGHDIFNYHFIKAFQWENENRIFDFALMVQVRKLQYTWVDPRTS